MENQDVGQVRFRVGLAGEKEFTQNISSLGQKVAGSSGSLAGAFSFLGAAIVAAFAIKGVKALASFSKEMLNVYKEAYVAQAKLETIMSKRLGASQDEIEAVRQLNSELQKTGVIEDDIAAAGATSLAQYVDSVDTLKTLIPQMENMAAYKYGYDTTSGNMEGIGSALGMAIQSGSTSRLSRSMGLAFSEAEENAFKLANNEERALMLAQKIHDTVGDMNEELGGDTYGKITQIKNAWGDVKENIGRIVHAGLAPILDRIKVFIDYLVIASDKLATMVEMWAGIAGKTVSINSGVSETTGEIEDMNEELEKSVFGFDNLNKLSGGGSGSGGGISSGGIGSTVDIQDNKNANNTLKFDVDLSKFQGILDTVGKVKKLFEDIWGVIKKVGGIMYEVFTSAIVQTFIDNIDTIKGYFQDVKDVFDTFVQLFDGWVQRTSEKLDIFQQRDLPGIIEEIKDDLQEAFDLFKDFWDSYIKPKFDRMTEKMKEMFGEGGTWDKCVDKLLTAFEILGKNSGWLMKIIAGLLGAVINAFATIGEMALTFLEGQMEELTGFVEFFAGIFEMLEGIFEGSTEKISDGFKLMLQGLLDYLVNGILKQMLGYIEDFINSALDLVGADPIDLTSKIKSPTIYEPKTYSNNHSAYTGLNAAKNTGSTSPIVIQNYTTLDGKVVAQSVNTVNNRNSNVLGSMNNGSSSGYQWRPAP